MARSAGRSFERTAAHMEQGRIISFGDWLTGLQATAQPGQPAALPLRTARPRVAALN